MKSGPAGLYSMTAAFRGDTTTTAEIYLGAAPPDGAVLSSEGQASMTDAGWMVGQATLNAAEPVEAFVVSLRFAPQGGCYLVDDVLVSYSKP